MSQIKKRIFSSLLMFPLTVFLIFKGSYLFNIFLLTCFFISIYEWFSMTKYKPVFFLGLIFLIFSFYSAYSLRNEFNNDYLYLFFIIMICISTDLGGYIFGKTFKGPKITKISPNKTYSGMIGSFLLTIIFYILLNYLNKYFELNLQFSVYNLFLVILISCTSQLGDLLISYFKRLSNLKDTGSIIPGHGGLLDRIDGVIFAIPLSYILIKFKIFQLYL